MALLRGKKGERLELRQRGHRLVACQTLEPFRKPRFSASFCEILEETILSVICEYDIIRICKKSEYAGGKHYVKRSTVALAM